MNLRLPILALAALTPITATAAAATTATTAATTPTTAITASTTTARTGPPSISASISFSAARIITAIRRTAVAGIPTAMVTTRTTTRIARSRRKTTTARNRPSRRNRTIRLLTAMARCGPGRAGSRACDGQLRSWHRRRQSPPFRQRRSIPLRSTKTVVLSLPGMPIRLPCSRWTPCHGRTRAIRALPANRRRVRQAKPSRHGLSVRNPKPVHGPSRCRVRPAWNAPAKATITNPERVMAAPVWCLRGNRRK